MSVEPGVQDGNRGKWLAALSFGVGIITGAIVGPFAFFFLYIFAIPIGLLVGGIAGGSWGRQNPITVTGFACLGVLLAGEVFVLGERFLSLPTRTLTWWGAPIIGGLGFWLLPHLARRLWPEQRTRETAAMIAVLAFLILAVGLWQQMQQSSAQADSDSIKVQLGFFNKCDALAKAEGHSATRSQPPQPAPHLKRLRSFPELCCPGGVPIRNREAGMGEWHIGMHILTNARFADTVGYYQNLLPGGSLRQKPVDVPFPCTRIDGILHGEPVSVIVADVPERSVSVAIF